MSSTDQILRQVGAQVFERGWLSSNCVLFARGASGASIVDTGYASHASQTVELIEHALGDAALGKIVNTHLHSDHCGGNAAVQRRWRSAVHVPAASFDAVNNWDENRLTYRATGQRCDVFWATDAVAPGSTLELGGLRWLALAAPGHDPDALMFFEPEHRVLISGDALWEDRLAIIFPELKNEPGFAPCRDVLRTIEVLQPQLVIPGHGPPFVDVAGALSASRSRLQAFEARGEVHRAYAAKALIMFRMLEWQRVSLTDMIAWLQATSIFGDIAESDLGTWDRGDSRVRHQQALNALEGLVKAGLVEMVDGVLQICVKRG